ncbi:AlpA family phage regulatory protein [Salmonella enterica]|nr:AlpA family phage regulatory protein [Salmonella enterica]EAR5545552.1 AlpA family phage regulatory protein [Salmonella enterica]EAT3229565.1 AlpA family phage regulatory protein [Salmonella enterica]EBF2167731.1 AlpA family phage regulatory protein [Salmonella enterica]EBI4450100.1 AlpA family transcriptional regulator [Salmonella enterica]
MDEQVLTKYEVMAALKYKSVSGFYTFCKRTPDFPKSFPLGLRRVGWLKREVDAYLVKKMNERNAVEG